MLARELVRMCPFWSEEKQDLVCNLRLLNDLVLLWQPDLQETTKGGIYIPEEVRDEYKPKIGVVIAAGPGYWDTRKYNPSAIKKGMVVVIDVRTPAFHGNKAWRITAEDPKGKAHSLPYMGEQDIRIIIDDEQEIDEIGSLISAGIYKSNILDIKS